jgi:hypothetical protein
MTLATSVACYSSKGLTAFASSSSFLLPGILFKEGVSVTPACMRLVFNPYLPNQQPYNVIRLLSEALATDIPPRILPRILLAPSLVKTNYPCVVTKKLIIQDQPCPINQAVAHRIGG